MLRCVGVFVIVQQRTLCSNGVTKCRFETGETKQIVLVMFLLTLEAFIWSGYSEIYKQVSAQPYIFPAA